MKNHFKFTLGKKIYVFVGFTVFLAAFGAAMISYGINARQINNYFKNQALYSARNFATLIDVDFYERLRDIVITEEYQAVRAESEEKEDDSIIVAYLKEKNIWEEFQINQKKLTQYLNTMEDIKYLYILSMGDESATQDMYLMAEGESLIGEVGYYEDREEDLFGVDASKEIPPTISNGDWGWLCSAFVPVYNENRKLICQVGCDVEMDDIMRERRNFLFMVIVSSVLFTAIVLIGAIILLNIIAIKPLGDITTEMKKFYPSSDRDYEKSGIINLKIKTHDEIGDIYSEIRSMQIRILEYLRDIKEITNEKERIESDAKNKEKELGEMSREAYKDSLTSVGSKAAYVKKVAELNELREKGQTEFAIVMIDVNFLKTINDTYGHTAGDNYLKGCCKMVCQIYKHSPVYRIGGDEFVAILTGSDYKSRHVKLMKSKAAFEESFAREDVEPWERFSAAFGMAEYTSDDSNVEMVFRRADTAMYEYKAEFKKTHKIGKSKR